MYPFRNDGHFDGRLTFRGVRTYLGGQWTTPDAFGGSYNYANNNPAAFEDPTGFLSTAGCPDQEHRNPVTGQCEDYPPGPFPYIPIPIIEPPRVPNLGLNVLSFLKTIANVRAKTHARMPDFVVVFVGGTFFVGLDGLRVVDRCGWLYNGYAPHVGTTGEDYGVQAGWLGSPFRPAPQYDELRNGLQGWSAYLSAGYGVGGSYSRVGSTQQFSVGTSTRGIQGGGQWVSGPVMNLNISFPGAKCQ